MNEPTKSPAKPKQRHVFSFGLKSLLLLMLLVAVFLGGYMFRTGSFIPPKVEGAWVVEYPRGATMQGKLVKQGKQEYRLVGARVLSGVYQLKGNQLIVTQPNDDRMQGLRWRYTGEYWTLVGEPPSRPTGSSYLGATLKAAPPSEEL